MKISPALVLLLAATLPAQTTPPPAGSDWSRVQQVAPSTVLRVASQHRPTVCAFLSADATSLTCTQTRSIFFFPVTHRLLFPRQEITAIKLSRQPLSFLAGAAIGTGAGIGIGAAADASSNNGGDDPHLLTFLGGLFGFAIGSGVGAKLDFLAGPTIYRTP